MTLAIPVVCVIMMSMLRVIAAVVAAEIEPASHTESMPLWQPGDLHIDDKYQSECTQHMCTLFTTKQGCACIQWKRDVVQDKRKGYSNIKLAYKCNKMCELKGLLQVDPMRG